ncbi:uncharacterized protein LOC141804263 [Halichoeres trimaculatus]|uniref:uncharacterized protein LOC141804263 n=1 Tax=Halichoeres trimaculatus TaxID=147232 RepID=UPI003D9EC5A8
MAKGRTKLNSDDSTAPAQPRSLRSRKRERHSTEISETEDVQQTICHQDIEESNTAADATLPQSPEQESGGVLTQQHQAEGEPCPTRQDPVIEEITTDTANVRAKEFEEEEKKKVTDTNRNFHQVGFTVHTDNENEVDQSEKDEEKNRNLSQTCIDQLCVVSRIPEESKISAENASEEQAGANGDSSSNLEKSQETSLEDTSSQCATDVKTAAKEETVEVPARKKRRMGMCGLTEKERSHFLQTQKRENGQKEPERAERLIENAADPVVQKDTTASPKPPSLSISTSCVSGENKEAIKPQSRDCEEDDRAEAELHITVITSDGTSTVCDPGSPGEKSFEVVKATAPPPEQTAESRSDLQAMEEEEGKEEDLGGKDSAIEDQSPSLANTEQSEDHGQPEALCPHVDGVPVLSDEKKEEFTCDEAVHEVSKAGGSSSQSQSGELNGCSVVLCEVPVTSCGPRGNYSFVPIDEPDAGLSTVTTGPFLTRDISDPFGPGCVEYVSDSQLNTISLTEEEAMERDEVLSFSVCHEDASELICGLVRELSSLNRKVMATHKELENLRRNSKSSRSATR